MATPTTVPIRRSHLRFDRTLLTVVLGLTALFTILDPPVSARLPVWSTAVFWFLHIGIGMLLAVAATVWLSRHLPRIPPHAVMRRVILGGLIGSLLFTPIALALDGIWLPESPAEKPDDWLDEWEQQGGFPALLAEWLSLLPAYLSSWMLVNAIPVGIRRAIPETTPTPEPQPALSAPAIAAIDAPPAPITDPEPTVTGPDPGYVVDEASDFLAALPPAIGLDLVAIQADLHYLQVRTTRGRAMVLASLGTAERALGTRGLRVHRSHWVALAHVRRVAQSASGMTLELSDGSRIPVSRRRAGEVRERLGQGFVLGTGP